MPSTKVAASAALLLVSVLAAPAPAPILPFPVFGLPAWLPSYSPAPTPTPKDKQPSYVPSPSPDLKDIQPTLPSYLPAQTPTTPKDKQPIYVPSPTPAKDKQPSYVAPSPTPAKDKQPSYVAPSPTPAKDKQPSYVAPSPTPAKDKAPSYVAPTPAKDKAPTYAAPTPTPKGYQPSQSTCSEQLATFDDLKTIPLILSQLSPIGTYQGITFNNLDVLQTGVLGLTPVGVLPQSGNNVADFAITNVLFGTPSFVASPSIKSFNLESLYFGCVVATQETAASVPEVCTLSFTAFKQGEQQAFQTLAFSFTPANLIVSPMVQAVFPSSWTNLREVDIAVVQSTTTELLTAVLIDNVKHCNN